MFEEADQMMISASIYGQSRDGTRNSSSLVPRGPGPFFTPRFPEEYILSILESSRSTPKFFKDLENLTFNSILYEILITY